MLLGLLNRAAIWPIFEPVPLNYVIYMQYFPSVPAEYAENEDSGEIYQVCQLRIRRMTTYSCTGTSVMSLCWPGPGHRMTNLNGLIFDSRIWRRLNHDL